MVRLFIEDREIELTDDVQFAITKQFEDLSNPTTIINDWSKTVSIPFSTKNNETFGHIYSPNRTIISFDEYNYLGVEPTSVKKWNGTGSSASDYVVDSLTNGQIVCDYNVEFIQVGLQKQNWEYSQTKNYYGNSGTGTFEFIYNSENCYRFEFSLRNSQSTANNGEVYFVQWALYNIDLISGQKYVVKFSYERKNGICVIYNFSLVKYVPLVGIYFDPLQKLDFRLEWNSTILMTGYAKLNQIKMNNGTGTYDITLFGQLGKVFQELSKITFNANDENTDYIIDGSQYVSTTINKELVKSSWTSSGQAHVGLSGASTTDIIGFAPNNSYYEEFNCDTYQSGSATSTPFTDVLESRWADGNGGYTTGVAPSTAIPNGLLPREIGEFRSYYQLPYIYWNKLWQIFQKKAEQLTGYTWDLDPTWFNVNNPYFYKLVYMLKPFNVKNGVSLENHYTKWGKDATQRSLGRSTTPNSPQVVRYMAMPTGSSVVTNNKIEAYPLLPTYDDPYYDQSYPHYPTNVAVFKCPNDFTSITFKWHIPMYIETKVSGSHLRDNAGLIVSIKMWGCDDNVTQENAHVVQTNNYIIRHEGSNFTYRDYTPIDTGSSPSEGDNRYKLVYTISSNFAASASKCGPYCYFTIECSYTNSDPMTNGLGDSGYTWYRDSAYVDVNLSSGAFRTGVHFTLNDLWDNSYNIFEQILNYCKMYRILVFIDEVQRKLKFIKSTRYFQSYSIVDWTDKVDKSKDFIITPVSFENKYVIFNYADNDSKLGKKYKESWGVNYGEKKLTTQYNFNEEKKNLFNKKITTSITNTDFALSWTNLYDYSKISYSLPAEISPYAKDDDGKAISMFGAFFFHNGKRSFDTTAALRMRGVNISDDTTFQQSNDTYYYSQTQSETSVSTYPALDIIYSDGEKLCLFNKPMENFTYAKNLNNSIGIYDMFWKLYIDERYNIQNKKVTCYLNLKPTDFVNFEYNNLIKIDNVVYIVNKIYDYNIMGNESTKVDLITIQDITSYIVDYHSDYLNVTPTSITIDGSSGTQTINVDAYQNAWSYILYDEYGHVVSDPIDITITKTNTSLTITKNGNYSLNYAINIYTLTRSTNVTVSGAREPYITFEPENLVAIKNQTTEFDIRIRTNLKNVNMIADSTVQWWNGSTWKTTAFSAASAVENWGSPEEDDTYNNAHEDRDFTIHIKIVNPTQNRQISFFEEMPVYQYYYLPYLALDPITVLNSDKTTTVTTDSVEYHGTSSIRGYYVYCNEGWTATLPQGVRSYGPTSGSSGFTSVTFDWGSGYVGQNKTITFADNSNHTWKLTCSYVAQ